MNAEIQIERLPIERLIPRAINPRTEQVAKDLGDSAYQSKLGIQGVNDWEGVSNSPGVAIFDQIEPAFPIPRTCKFRNRRANYLGRGGGENLNTNLGCTVAASAVSVMVMALNSLLGGIRSLLPRGVGRSLPP